MIDELIQYQSEVVIFMDNRTEIFRNRKPSIIGIGECYKSAVCIPMIKKDDKVCLLFEVRSSKIKQQPGDICFPGGMLENGETYEQAAFRETVEELLIDEGQLEIIGPTDIIHLEHLIISPFAAVIHDYENTWSDVEVEHTFTVPLDFFFEHEPDMYTIDFAVSPQDEFPYERIVGGKKYRWRSRREEVYFYQYEEYTIWGLTAKIIRNFVNIIKQNSETAETND